MRAMRCLGSLAVAGGLALTAWGQTAAAAEVFTVSSATFKDGGMMPKRVANNTPNNPNCVGENISPQLSWTGVPDGTKSFAFVMIDPEVRVGLGIIHWVAYGIDPKLTGFAEGEISKSSDKYVAGKNSHGVGLFEGPCTPAGVAPHHYTFLMFATDLDPKALPPGLTRDELAPKIARMAEGDPSHIKGIAGLVGLWVKPSN